MDFDLVAWDDEDDPAGNVQHIRAHGISPDEFLDVLLDPRSAPDTSRSSGRPMRFGWTSTGRYIAIVFEIEDDGEDVILIPVTAYNVSPPC